jgi:hypothetical protein
MPGDYTHLKAGIADKVGDVPALAQRSAFDLASAPDVDRKAAAAGRLTAKVALAPVADVLARYGFDPAEELARILTERVVVLDSRGNPVLGEDGKPITRTALDPVDHAKLTSDLLQYTRPKLKASEITVKPAELTPEQIDRRIEALLARAGGAAS